MTRIHDGQSHPIPFLFASARPLQTVFARLVRLFAFRQSDGLHVRGILKDEVPFIGRRILGPTGLEVSNLLLADVFFFVFFSLLRLVDKGQMIDELPAFSVHDLHVFPACSSGGRKKEQIFFCFFLLFLPFLLIDL